MNLESRTVNTNKSPEELYQFLTQVNNYSQLMPQDTKFETSNNDQFMFGLKGMPEIRLSLLESTPCSRVNLGSTSDKFNFTLSCDITPDNDGSQAQLIFNGEFNTMMAMMIKGPINKFLDQLATGIEQL